MKTVLKIGEMVDHAPVWLKDAFVHVAKDSGLKTDDLELHRHTHSEKSKVNQLDTAKRQSLKYVSARTQDRDDEIVIPKGMNLSQFKKYMHVLVNHNYSLLPIGSDEWIEADDFGIKALTNHADTGEGTLANVIWHLVEQGHMKASSVGFVPTSFTKPGARDWDTVANTLQRSWKEFDKARAEKSVSRIITGGVLLEHSFVSVPCNTDAEMVQVVKGMVSDDKVLKQLGWDLTSKIVVPKGLGNMSANDVHRLLSNLLPKDTSGNNGMAVCSSGWVQDVFDDYFIYSQGPAMFRQGWAMVEGKPQLIGEPTKVRSQTVYIEEKAAGQAPAVKVLVNADGTPVEKGGEGSGFHGHAGIPGHQGGSQGGGADKYTKLSATAHAAHIAALDEHGLSREDAELHQAARIANTNASREAPENRARYHSELAAFHARHVHKLTKKGMDSEPCECDECGVERECKPDMDCAEEGCSGKMKPVKAEKGFDEDDGRWVTMNGQRVFIREGQTAAEAVAERFGGDGKKESEEAGKQEEPKREALHIAAGKRAQSMSSTADKITSTAMKTGLGYDRAADAHRKVAESYRDAANEMRRAGEKAGQKEAERLASLHDDTAKKLDRAHAKLGKKGADGEVTVVKVVKPVMAVKVLYTPPNAEQVAKGVDEAVQRALSRRSGRLM